LLIEVEEVIEKR